jgi:hypothetical protein
MKTLEQYRDEFLALPLSSLKVIEHRNYGILTATVVHREAPFQVEMVITQPKAQLVAHRHPHIDAYEVYISGDLRFVAGESAEQTNQLLADISKVPEKIFKRAFERFKREHGPYFHIKSTDWHAGFAGETGAAFWSVQQWSDGEKLTAAGVDWEGPAL